MKIRQLVLFSVLFLFTLSALAGDGKKYGKDLTVKEKTAIADILKNPQKFEGKRILIEGEIEEVCQMMGCWIKIKDTTSTEAMQFKVQDGVIEFPKEVKGKKVKAEGVVSVKITSKEDLIKQGEHEAQEQGKKFDPASITGPKTVIRIEGEGAVIGE